MCACVCMSILLFDPVVVTSVRMCERGRERKRGGEREREVVCVRVCMAILQFDPVVNTPVRACV